MHAWEELVERCAEKRSRSLGGLSDAAFLELETAVRANPERYVDDDAEAAFLEVARALDRVTASMADDDLRDDDDYMAERARRNARLADDCRRALALDGGCVDAQVLLALATKTDDAMLDAVGAAMADGGATGPDADELARWDDPFARPRIRATEVMSRLLLQTGRIGAARDLCGRLVDADPSDPTGARYTLALAHARMEDEDALDALDARYARRGNAWFHLARTLLLFKLDRAASAGRALDGYCSLCEGGAFALLRPTFIEAYLPDRPDFAPHGFTEATLAVHEADPLIVDAPDFANGAGARPGVTEQAMAYAKSQGLDW